LLALRHLKGQHSGENIAASVLKAIRNYKIKERAGFFVLDNRDIQSNDVAVNEILRALHPEMSRKRRRLRCLAHVTNVIAKAFLLGQKADEFTEESLVAEHQSDTNKTSRAWKNRGLSGSCKTFICYIRLSPQRRQDFKKCQIGKKT
jgi:hypothetical protein